MHQLADVPRYILYEGVAALELEAEERAAAFQQPPAGSDAFAAVTNLEAKRRRGRLGA